MSKLIATYTEIETLIARQASGQPIDETRLAELRKSLIGDDEKLLRAFTPEDDKEIIRLRANGFGWARIGRRIGRDDNTVRNRFKRLERDGITMDDEPDRTRLSNRYYYWRDIAKENGINGDAFYQRTQAKGWKYEQAATTPLRKQRRFTPAEDKRLIAMRGQGIPYREIARELERNQYSVEDRYRRIRKELRA